MTNNVMSSEQIKMALAEVQQQRAALRDEQQEAEKQFAADAVAADDEAKIARSQKRRRDLAQKIRGLDEREEVLEAAIDQALADEMLAKRLVIREKAEGMLEERVRVFASIDASVRSIVKALGRATELEREILLTLQTVDARIPALNCPALFSSRSVQQIIELALWAHSDGKSWHPRAMILDTPSGTREKMATLEARAAAETPEMLRMLPAPPAAPMTPEAA